MKLSVEEFYSQLFDALQRHVPSGDLEITEMNMLRFKGRIYIAVSLFIDVFYATRTHKTSFAVVRKGKRIFGIDNLGGWHSHPFGRPERHVQIAEPSIAAAVMECSKAIFSQGVTS